MKSILDCKNDTERTRASNNRFNSVRNSSEIHRGTRFSFTVSSFTLSWLLRNNYRVPRPNRSMRQGYAMRHGVYLT